MNAALKLVVFDMDGTLIDSQEFIIAAMQRGFEAAGHAPPADAAILAIVGLSLPEAVRKLSPDLEEAEVHRIADLYKHSFVQLRAERGGEGAARMYEGARSALDQLHGKPEVLLGVATGKARRGLDHALDTHDLGKYFLTAQTADDHPSKPHPSMLHKAIRDTGAEAAHAVMIGDTTYDIEMGRAAGYRTIGVSWGYHASDSLRDSGADHIITHFDQLDETLRKLWSV